MAGNDKNRIVLTSRDRLLLKEIAVGRLIDREMAKKIAGFHSTTRANTRLLQLVRAGLLKRFFLGTRAGGTKSLYCLSQKGALVVDAQVNLIQRKSNSLLVGDQFVEHQLLINAIWLQVKFTPVPPAGTECLRWLRFPSVLSRQTPLIPDGYFELKNALGIHCLFCEVDRGTETLKIWDKKITLYLQLAVTQEFQTLFQQSRFRVLVVAHSERRLGTLRKAVLKRTEKIFWFATLDDINRHGLFAPIWQRPAGSQKAGLF